MDTKLCQPLMTSSVLLASTAAQPELTEGISSDPLGSERKLQGTSMSSNGLNNLQILVSQVKQETRISCICISSTDMGLSHQVGAQSSIDSIMSESLM